MDYITVGQNFVLGPLSLIKELLSNIKESDILLWALEKEQYKNLEVISEAKTTIVIHQVYVNLSRTITGSWSLGHSI